MKRIMTAISLLITLLLVSSCSKNELATSSDLKKLYESIESYQYSEAYTIYSELPPEDMTNANKMIKEKVEEIKNKYLDGTFDYSSTVKALDAYRAFDVSGLSEIITEVNTDNQYSSNFDSAQRYFNSGKYRDALSMLGTISADYRNYSDVEALYNECVSAFQNSVKETCESYLASNDYDSIFSTLDSAYSVLPNDFVISQMVTDYQIRYENFKLAQLKSSCESYLSTDNYAGIFDVIEQGYTLFPDNEEIKLLENDYRDRYNAYLLNGVKTSCEELAAMGEYYGLFEMLQTTTSISSEEAAKLTDQDNAEWENTVLSKAETAHSSGSPSVNGVNYDAFMVCYDNLNYLADLGISSEVVAKTCDGYYKDWIDENIRMAQEYASSTDYISAFNATDYVLFVNACLVSERRMNSTKQKELESLNEEYESKMPIVLTDCPEIERGGSHSYDFEYVGTVNNQFGETYTNTIRNETYDENYIIFNVNNRFEKFDFTVWATSTHYTCTDIPVHLYIYLDDKLVKSVENVKNGSDSQAYSVDISGGKRLKLVTKCSDSYVKLYLGEAMLHN